MVKIEELAEDGAVSAGAKVYRNAGMGPQPDPAHGSFKAEEEGHPTSPSSNLRSQFISMGFSPVIVDKMLQKNGEHDSNSLLEALLSYSAHPNSRSESSSSLGSLFYSDNEETCSPLVSRIEANQDTKAEPDCFLKRKSYLLSTMNFSHEEVDLAFNQLGEEAPLDQLVDCILAAQGAGFSEVRENGHATNEVKIEPDCVGETETEYSESYWTLRYYYDDDDDENKSFKKVKHLVRDDGGASSSRAANTPWLSGDVRSLTNGSMKKVDNEMGSGTPAYVDLGKPPYFLYGNFVNITKDTWKELSEFLFSVQPEFVNTQTFSALSRKEGYIHNLPTERRRVVGSNSWMTTEGAAPFTVEDPMQPHELELGLGYPSGHTDMLGLNTRERTAALKLGFQTDTLAYLLSVLKEMYPDGLRVLSVYSGVGGAEVALHRLGIPLKCVVSIEESEVNRKILKRWWGKTKQAGKLRQVSSIKKVKTSLLKDLMNEFGGFDLVVGGTYSSWKDDGKQTVNVAMGMDVMQFYDYAYVVKSVRSMHGLM